MRAGSRDLLFLPCASLRLNIPASMYVNYPRRVKNQVSRSAMSITLHRNVPSAVP